jgi:integrase
MSSRFRVILLPGGVLPVDLAYGPLLAAAAGGSAQAAQVGLPHSAASDFVFATALGTPLGYRNVERRGVTRAAKEAGLNQDGAPPLRVHDLRHTFASHLVVDLKLDVAQVSRILGHARPSITLDTYTHLFDQEAHANNIRERMAKSLFGSILADDTTRQSAENP